MPPRGWTLPRTPTGSSAAVCPPPWHFSGDMISVDFELDPAAAAEFVPSGMAVDNAGSASFLFADWSCRADHDPRLVADPARGQYMEAFLLVHGTFNEMPVGYVPFIWVDSDLSLIRGLIQGFPKQIGSISMSRAVDVGSGGPRKAPGSSFAAHVSERGERLCSASVTLDRQETDYVPKAVATSLMLNRVFPSLDGSDGVDELVRNVVRATEVGSVYSGDATIELIDSRKHEFGILAPITSRARGFVFSFAFSIIGGKAVRPAQA